MPKKPSQPSLDPFLTRESARYEQPIASREHLLNLIESHTVPVSQEHIAASLQYDDEQQIEALRRRLNAMARDGQIFRNRRGGFLSFDHMDLEKGYVQTHPDGFGFLTPESGGKDIFLPERQMRKLMNGDKAAVKIAVHDRRRNRKEGVLIAVLERAHQSVVGRFHRESGIEFVVPDDKRLTRDILVNRDVGHSASPGDIVLVRISEYPTFERSSQAFVGKTYARFSALARNSELPCVGDARSLGSMNAIEIVKNRNSREPDEELAASIIAHALTQGLILISAGPARNVIRVLVPLTAPFELIEEGLDILEASIRHCL